MSKAWQRVESFAALEALNPRGGAGHGRVTTLAQAQKDTGHLPRAPRVPMGKAVEAGTDMGAAIRSFDAAPAPPAGGRLVAPAGQPYLS